MFKQFEDFAAGTMPDTLDELTRLGRGIVAVNAKVRQSLCVIVAIGRDQYIKDLGEWAGWVEENFGLTGSDRCNCYRVGKLLTALRDLNMFKCHKRCFALDFDKLLQLCRIKPEEVEAFVSQHEIESMSRAAVKLAVNTFLGLVDTSGGEQSGQLELPGFEKTLDYFADVDGDQIKRAINTPSTALKSLTIGAGLVDAAIDYELAAPSIDLETLQECHAELIAQAAKLQTIIAGKLS